MLTVCPAACLSLSLRFIFAMNLAGSAHVQLFGIPSTLPIKITKLPYRGPVVVCLPVCQCNIF